MVELKPCPFCGNKNVRLRGDVTCGFETMNVFCDNCHATGPWCDSEGGAIKCWNYRGERTCHMTKEQDPDFPDVWWNCSNCHAGVWLEVQVRDLPNYCPNCGAKVVE